MSQFAPSFLQEARRWIRFNTVSRRPNGPFVFYLRKKFQALGFRVALRKYRRGRGAFYNLAAWKGPTGARPLLLNTHLDTVPPGPASRWTSTGGDPWGARLRGGRLHGLGVADVKLNLLCQWEALRGWAGRRFKKPLCVVGTFGEEIGQIGVARFLKDRRGPRPALAFVGEPSELRPVNRHRGYIVFDLALFPRERVRVPGGISFPAIKAEGRSAHSSTPGLGVNALEELLASLSGMKKKGSIPRVVDFHGGTAVNQVPAEARAYVLPMVIPAKGPKRAVPLVPWETMSAVSKRLSREIRGSLTWNWGRAASDRGCLKVYFDVRYPPAADADALIRRVERAVAEVCSSRETRFALRVEHHNPALSPGMPAPLKRFVERALKESGLPVRWTAKATCTEAGQYRRKGIPVLVFGPGRSTGNIHRPNESVAVADLHRAVRFYRTLIELWCRPSS